MVYFKIENQKKKSVARVKAETRSIRQLFERKLQW